MKVPARALLVIAAALWLVPGFIVLRRGLVTMPGVWPAWRIIGAVLVFCAFQFFIFRRLVNRHIERIHGYGSTRQSVARTFDAKTYAIIVFFIALGVVLRVTGWAPPEFVAFFYPGIGLALALAGVKFLLAGLRKA